MNIKYKIIKKEKSTGIEHIFDTKIQGDKIYEFDTKEECQNAINVLTGDERYKNYDVLMQETDYDILYEASTFHTVDASELPELPIYTHE